MQFNRDVPPSGLTGRSLVLFAEDAAGAGVQAVRDSTDAPLDAIAVYERLGVAVVDAPPEQIASAQGARSVMAIEAERIVHALEGATARFERRGPAAGGGLEAAPLATAAGGLSGDYLRGYHDAVEHLAEIGAPAPVAPVAPDETEATWGLQAVGVLVSTFTGQGVRVAVLDTGFDVGHPDFADRSVTTRSFIEGEEVQDGNGHGTHCIGTALGPAAPGTGPRYGVASGAEILAGKVLSDAGSGNDTGILAGIDWAVQQGCAVVSMSLGAAVRAGDPFSQVFERAARRAQAAGTLIVAAAGNESERPEVINPVGHPANCPSILAVAALDSALAIAPFSNRGLDPDGGQVDVAGPGVDVYSSWPMPDRYHTISGTSMATPHAAGVAALLAEANPGERGAALGRLLVAGARRLGLPSADVGSGVVQAP